MDKHTPKYNCTFLLHCSVTPPSGYLRAAPMRAEVMKSTAIYHKKNNCFNETFYNYVLLIILQKYKACIKNIHDMIQFTINDIKWSHFNTIKKVIKRRQKEHLKSTSYRKTKHHNKDPNIYNHCDQILRNYKNIYISAYSSKCKKWNV